jgi:uncharacterized protein (DUF58 family)
MPNRRNLVHSPAPLHPQLHAQAAELAAKLPHLQMEARRVVSAIYGVHGRRKAGVGETFWQYRAYAQGESARMIDWRRSSREDKLFVRMREWEAAHAVHLWMDSSPSMHFASHLASASKAERAVVLGLAIADMLVDAGESVGLLGAMPPRSSRQIMSHMSEALMQQAVQADENLAPMIALPSHAECILFTDALVMPEFFAQRLSVLAQQGARGHVVHLIDPVEETFPFTGHVVMTEEESELELHTGDAAEWGTRYRKRFAEHQAQIALTCTRHQWTYMRHHTDRPASEAALPLMLALAEGR